MKIMPAGPPLPPAELPHDPLSLIERHLQPAARTRTSGLPRRFNDGAPYFGECKPP
jgi:hypothetical protein